MRIVDYEKLKKILVGKTIVHVAKGNNSTQMDFILMFDDGTKLEVNAIGDDMSYIDLYFK